MVLNNDLAIDLRDSKFKRLLGFEIYHLKGIDVSSSIFRISKYTTNPLIYVKYSYFNFYSQNKLLSSKNCYSNETFNSFNSLFSKRVQFLSFSDCYYGEKTCILLFKNSLIVYLKFEYSFSSSIGKNYLKFDQNSSFNFSLKSNIETVHFNDFYRINLNTNILDDKVFELTKVIYFYGSIDNIQIDLFQRFHLINSVNFELYNLQEFFNKGFKWTDNLNAKDTRIEISLTNYHRTINRLYEYPNEDWCLVQHVVRYKRIKFFADYNMYGNNTNLSCVLIGLMKNHNLDELSINQWYINVCKNDLKIFTKFFTNCLNIKCSFDQVTESNFSSTFDYYDLLKTIFYIEYISELIVEPIYSILGILANFLVIYILKAKSNKIDFKEKMYSYIYYNSLSNVLIIFLDLLGFMNKCLFNSIGFCPIIRETIVAQIIFISINFFKTFSYFFSNVTILFFSIERYMKLMNEGSKKLIKFFKFCDKYFFSLSFTLGLILNVCKLFEYKMNTYYDTLNFPIRVDVIDFKDELNCLIFFISLFLGQFLSNFAAQIINLIIDILMFFKYKDAMKKKAKITSTRANLKNDSSKDNKLLRIIIIFALINFLIRLPEMILFCVIRYYQLKASYKKFLFLFNFEDSYTNVTEYVCYYGQNCEKIEKAARIFYKISFLSNIFFLYLTNKIFRNKIKSLVFKNRKSSK